MIIILAVITLVLGVSAILASFGKLGSFTVKEAQKKIFSIGGLVLVIISAVLLGCALTCGSKEVKVRQPIGLNLNRMVQRINTRAPHELNGNAVLTKASHKNGTITLEHTLKGVESNNLDLNLYIDLLSSLAKKEQCERTKKLYLAPPVKTVRLYKTEDGHLFPPIMVECPPEVEVEAEVE